MQEELRRKQLEKMRRNPKMRMQKKVQKHLRMRFRKKMRRKPGTRKQKRIQKMQKTAIGKKIKKLKKIKIDNVPDSSYIAAFLSPRPHSVFRSVGTTEKPDVFTAKIAEGRVGLIVDGSPIALTAPYTLTEDFQTSEDYFVSPFMATIFRFLRFISLFVAIFLPAFYVSAQLFKIQLLPLGLTLTIASSVRDLPLSPALEMFVVLFLLETLKEADVIFCEDTRHTLKLLNAYEIKKPLQA